MSEERKFSPYNCRDSRTYLLGLFPDDPTGIKFLNPIFYDIRDTIRGDVESWFKFSPALKNSENNDAYYSRDYVRKDMGGQKTFFSREAIILDLGCGFGAAASEFSQTRRAQIFGLDKRYAKEIPLHPSLGKYVAGDWENLPFRDNTFTGILAFESYPRYGGYDAEADKNTFKNVTRICRPGAVWRATVGFPGFELGNEESDKGFQPVYSNDMIIHNLNDNGWDVFYGRRMFIANLVDKRT